MKLNPIDEANLDQVLLVLKRGFPERDEAFWRTGLHRILTSPARHAREPIGFLMNVGDENVGIILTISSEQPDAAGVMHKVVNLAAWYIDEPHRWLAALMLQKIVAADGVVFTDLTPNPAAERIDRQLGFQILNEGFQVFALPWTALRNGKDGEVIAPEQASISDAARATLAQHSALGCVVAVLQDEAGQHPLIFSRIRRKRLPGARVILTESKSLIANHLAAISRFLLRQGMVFLHMDASRNEAFSGSMISYWSSPIYIKGAVDRNRIDYTYSELIFLG